MTLSLLDVLEGRLRNLKVHSSCPHGTPCTGWTPPTLARPLLQGLFLERTKVMPILFWLLGVPLLVVIALYLLHVI